MPELLYITGPPASGKSTLAAHLVRDLPATAITSPLQTHAVGLPARIVYGGTGVVQIGRDRGAFSGTDALPMNVGPHARNLLTEDGRPELVLAEGDRLGTASFFRCAVEAGYRLVKCAVLVDNVVLHERRMARAEAGWSPNAAWLKGRDTKAARQEAEADVIVPGDDLAEAERHLLDYSTVAEALEVARPC